MLCAGLLISERGSAVNDIAKLAEKLAHLHIIYHWQVFPLSAPAKQALEARIKRARDRLDAALVAEGSALGKSGG